MKKKWKTGFYKTKGGYLVEVTRILPDRYCNRKSLYPIQGLRFDKYETAPISWTRYGKYHNRSDNPWDLDVQITSTEAEIELNGQKTRRIRESV